MEWLRISHTAMLINKQQGIKFPADIWSVVHSMRVVIVYLWLFLNDLSESIIFIEKIFGRTIFNTPCQININWNVLYSSRTWDCWRLVFTCHGCFGLCSTLSPGNITTVANIVWAFLKSETVWMWWARKTQSLILKRSIVLY